ncbi:hypothetical protein [Mesorhizobium loti]|uniref:Uncharacterized protein n=1 Tax=Mesorhizobium loti R88b TaxID=935548 RepID=A0A6M7WPS4_RHILI|nr:hypothetical protein [Mesorhizobium loti]QKD03516.1 hypothetical protein EB235_20140 [Mesorhizobium loti R88b]
MNLRRGLFRVWIVASICWLIFVGSVTYWGVQRQIAEGDAFQRMKRDGFVIGTFCDEAKGQENVDFDKAGKAFNEAMKDTAGQEREWCQYSLAGYHKAHPEEASKTDDQILAANFITDDSHPWQTAFYGLVAAAAAPLAVLLVWFVGTWVMAGFRKSEKPS